MRNEGLGDFYKVSETLCSKSKVAVLIPCKDEAASIINVVRDFQAVFCDADIYVYDNNSIDDTVDAARRVGAIVRREMRQGKGHVVRRMFADIEADIYVLVDGDGTYNSPSASAMVSLLQRDCLDMVVGVRKHGSCSSAYRPGHFFGNRLFCSIVGTLFGSQFRDIFSGFRVMSRRFVKSFPNLSKGFEIETQLTVHALELALPCAEIETPYYERLKGSSSKLRTLEDGMRIMIAIFVLFKEVRPFVFYGLLSLLSLTACLGFGIPVVFEYFQSGLVPRFPTAILAAGLGVVAAIFFSVGLTLDSVSRAKLEIKRLAYLSLKNVF